MDKSIENKVLGLLLAAAHGESGNEWLTSDELLNLVRRQNPGMSFQDVLRLAKELSSKGFIDWLPVQREHQVVGFTARISRLGRNTIVHGQPSLTRP